MASLSYNKEAEIIQAFNSTSRYLDDLLNIDNPYVESYKPYVESWWDGGSTLSTWTTVK